MNRNEIVNLTVHEMKTPMAVIHGYTELMKFGLVEENEFKDMIAKMAEESMRAAKLTDEMAAFELADDEASYTAVREIHLGDVCRRVAAVIKERRGKENIDISVNGDAVIEGNRTLLTMLAENIIENGVIFNHSAEKKLVCNISEADGKISFVTEDNGIGIRKEEREAVFECFYRVEKEASRANGCNGMGLAICQKIVKRYGGEISIDGTENNGTRVTVKF